MSPDIQIVLSGALTFGIPLLFAVHELRALKRPWRGPDDGRDPQGPTPPRVPPGDAPALRPLPACLIPALPARPALPAPAPSGPRRTRELEPA